MVEAVRRPIDDRAVGEERSEAAAASLDQRRLALDVQKALVLPGETGVRQVLGGGGAADGHADIAAPAQQFAVSGAQLGDQWREVGRLVDQRARRLAAPRQLGHVSDVEIVDQRMQLRPGAGGGEAVAIGVGDDGEANRRTHAGVPQGALHLAQRRVLAADQSDVLAAERFKWADVVRRHADHPAHAVALAAASASDASPPPTRCAFMDGRPASMSEPTARPQPRLAEDQPADR